MKPLTCVSGKQPVLFTKGTARIAIHIEKIHICPFYCIDEVLVELVLIQKVFF
jgi:hypothetical protein